MGWPLSHTHDAASCPPGPWPRSPGSASAGTGEEESRQWKRGAGCLMAASAPCLGVQIRNQHQSLPPPHADSSSRNTTSSGQTVVVGKIGNPGDEGDCGANAAQHPFPSASAASGWAAFTATETDSPQQLPASSTRALLQQLLGPL